MKKKNSLAAYILIGIGIFFLLRQLRIPILTDFYSLPTLLIIIGLSLIIYSYNSKKYQNLFIGTIILGIGIHIHGLNHYRFWIDHWAIYLLIIGIAFLIRYLQTKDGLFAGIVLIGLSILLIFSIELPEWLAWVYVVIDYIEDYWPIAIIIIGIYLLKKKK
ncbi:putative flippase GtrA [Virgibacillus natechei]|uniref:Flippase GtrA n=1 Tax=Virgibacillus natechei TaxID=1216297 RepID=A0ABS4ID00_9BACI|nr:DUF5668 domain-containing protein [Virgibacillus natechei]MBP1968815.1 putative flippase GtrA [Virgibacillus natechei]UZD11614.1 DUF5668 domain-containing protein [Virgibacillus natechei]